MLVAVAPRRWRLLADALGDAAEQVAFTDMHELGANPARIIPAWQAFLDAHPSRTGTVHGIGEPVWPGRSAAELDECERHEQLLNVAFGAGRAWRLLCPYDVACLGERELRAAERSHPLETGPDGARRCEGFCPREDPFAGELASPPADAEAMRFDRQGLADVREAVGRLAARASLTSQRGSDLVLAVNELAANSVLHGGGGGSLRAWLAGDCLVCEIRNAGSIDSPLAGRVAPEASQLGGRGLWMANQVCDLVQIRSSPADGTAVRVHMRVE